MSDTVSEPEMSTNIAHNTSQPLLTPESYETDSSELLGWEENEPGEINLDLIPIAEIPFQISYVLPENKSQLKSRRPRSKGPIETSTSVRPKEQTCLDIDSLTVHYQVQPGDEWESMKTYSNFIS
jgi:hypothetical protein